MTLPISYFRFYFPEYVLKTRLPPNCATGFLDSLKRTLSCALPQLVENPLFEGKKFFFAGGVRGGGSPFVLNRMSAKSLR